MKKTLLLAAALACSGVVAQEKQVWACQMEASAMLLWENNSWERYGVAPYNILFTVNASGSSGSAKKGDGYAEPLTCSLEVVYNRYSCHDSTLTDHYMFSPSTAKLGVSRLGGAIDNTADRDSVSALVFNCTKF